MLAHNASCVAVGDKIESERPTLRRMSRNIRLELAYDGTDFHGWQIQPNLDTIQGQITNVLSRITKESIQVHGSGRTDGGAHALVQVCNFHTESRIPLASFKEAMNSL